MRVRPPLQTLATVPYEWLTRGRSVAPREAYTCRDARRAVRHARLHAACQALAVRAVWELCAAACSQTDCLLPIMERARPMGPCVPCRAWCARGGAKRVGITGARVKRFGRVRCPCDGPSGRLLGRRRCLLQANAQL